MMGLQYNLIVRTFREVLPPEATLFMVEQERFIKEALRSPFIQKQIALGVYHFDPKGPFGMGSIYWDFLSVARTFTDLKAVEVCPQLLMWHMSTVPQDYALGYAKMVALHEQHHLQLHHGDVDLHDQAKREMECHEELALTHPEVAALARSAENMSKSMQRVYARMRRLEKKDGRS